ncbi:fasciclin domain-containing protein [uncultured Chitinophaga sp.]|uniref:fasciclin domain-containing protein n=1 Tax=uncultured Chitinophaga sp. TaxID=339340 RepID=UPI0025FD4A2A|nr:fasciclin domain-containing protein [uncultured Chitinophaga sp.]
MLNAIRSYIAVASLLLLFTACSHDDLEVVPETTNYRPAADFIKNNYDLSLFYAGLQHAGMLDELNGKGPFTVLAPNNTAFNDIGIRNPGDFDKLNADSLRNMLHLHILNRRLLVSEIPVNGVDIRYASMYNGKELYVTLASYAAGSGATSGPNYLFFNGAFAVKKEVTLANGTMHVLDKVMKYKEGKVQEWLESRPEYAIFVAALKKFGFWEQLSGPGPYTVFAPDNDAFIAAGLDLATVQAMSVDAYVKERLFGLYVFAHQRFFISDFHAFTTIYGTGGFTQKITNDSYHRSIAGNKNFFTGEMNYVLSYGNASNTYINTVNATVPGRCDYLSDNGIVHHLPGLVVLPADAKK